MLSNIDAVTVPAASETRINSGHKTKSSCLREPGFMLPLWDYLNLHTDPRVQLLKVLENSIGNGGIPHPVRANFKISRSVIYFTVILVCLVCLCCVLFF